MALEKYKLLYPNNERKFNASNGWCTDFKKRWNLITVKIKVSKKASKQFTDIEIRKFIETCIDAKNKVGEIFF